MFHIQSWNFINTWLSSRPRLAAVVGEHGLPVVDFLALFDLSPLLQLKLERRPLATTQVLPHRPIFADGGQIKGHSSRLIFFPPFSSTLESDRQLSSPSRVICCVILCLSVFSLCFFSSIFPSVSRLRYGLVGIVAGDGAPRSLSDGGSSGVRWTRPFSFSDSSL